MKFYVCEICGNMVSMIEESGLVMRCCGQNMTEIIPATTDGAVEKHIPVYKIEDNIVTVNVGSEEHPMTKEHYIEWIAIETEQGRQRKMLKPGDKPCARFALTDDDCLVNVFAYCNLHGLWC